MKVNSICVLGGGTGGFATAALLAKHRDNFKLKYDIKVIYSGKIGSIGVGESTILGINELFKYLDLKDSDWMAECNATYKISIRFEDFRKKGKYFYYPFGQMDAKRYDPQTVNDWFAMRNSYPEICTPENAAYYFLPHAILAEKNRLTNDEDFDLDPYSAYHFDANLLGEYLKKYAEDLGVEFVDDTFVSAELNDNGFVKSLVCKDGVYESDLFVDCTGFKSLLLGETLKEEYISFSDTLINNKVLRAKIPYTDKEKQLKNYTNCVALKNGWCWEIPLWEHLSVGYVHTNKFASSEEIEKQFFERVGECKYDVLEYKTGRYKRGWVKNVVAVGLSYGFLEPLESTGIATTLANCYRLIEGLSRRDMQVTQVDRDGFNSTVGKINLDSLRHFIELHYILSSRDDSDYWRYVTEDIDYHDESRQYLDFLVRTWIGRSYFKPGAKSLSGNLFIAAGMDYNCISKSTYKFTDTDMPGGERRSEEVKRFAEFLKLISEQTETLRTSYSYLKETIYE